MAVKRIDLSPERETWEEAVLGEDVRGAGISSLQKTEDVINETVDDVNQAAEQVRSTAVESRDTLAKANAALKNADTALENVEEIRTDLTARVESGDFKGDKGDKGDTGLQGPKGSTGATGPQGPKGDKGDKGDTGAQGESGVMVPTSGMFSLYLDPETGNLYADYPDGSSPPKFEYEEETGNLYYVTD